MRRRCVVCQAELSRYNDSKILCFLHQDTHGAALERKLWFVQETGMWTLLASTGTAEQGRR